MFLRHNSLHSVLVTSETLLRPQALFDLKRYVYSQALPLEFEDRKPVIQRCRQFPFQGSFWTSGTAYTRNTYSTIRVTDCTGYALGGSTVSGTKIPKLGCWLSTVSPPAEDSIDTAVSLGTATFLPLPQANSLRVGEPPVWLDYHRPSLR